MRPPQQPNEPQGEGNVLEIVHGSSSSWEAFAWPEWVPMAVRTAIEEFWSSELGRGPSQWGRSCAEYRAPDLGTVVGIRYLNKSGWGAVCSANDPRAVVLGRYVHCWNNIGRVVRDDGSYHYVFISSTWDSVPEIEEIKG